jgi:uncharacterized protein YjbI with pentapeptide repeats
MYSTSAHDHQDDGWNSSKEASMGSNSAQFGSVTLSPLHLRLNTRIARREFQRLRNDIRSGSVELSTFESVPRQLFAFENELEPLAELSSVLPSRDTLAGTNLTGVRLSQLNISNLDLSKSNLTNANCILSKFRKIDASEAILPEAQCNWSVWINVNLFGANLSYADFSGADLSNVDFSDCDLSNAKFHSAKLLNAKFNGATLVGCDFSKAYLESTDFDKSEFDDTNFSYASLDKCHFTPVALKRGNFYQVRWKGSTRHGLPSRAPGSLSSFNLLSHIERIRKRVRIVRTNRLLFNLAICMGYIKTVPIPS